jgi:capsular polysaccharide biosynthesis protein
MTTMNNQLHQNSNRDIDIRELFMLFWDKKIFILLFTSMFFTGSVIYALTAEPLYQSSSTLQIVSTNSSGGGGSSGTKSLGGAASIFLGSSGSSQDYVLATKTIYSRDFFKHLISFDGVLAQLVAYESYDSQKRELLFDPEVYDAKNKKWLLSYNPDDSNDLSYLAAYRTYKSLLEVSWAKDESEFLTLTMTHPSPYFAQSFISLVIQELNLLVRQRKFEEATKSLEYLNSQLSETRISEVRNSINQLIKSQLNNQMMSQVRKDYLLKPLDLPHIPDERISPKRTFITVAGTILGFLIALIIGVIHRYNFELHSKA